MWYAHWLSSASNSQCGWAAQCSGCIPPQGRGFPTSDDVRIPKKKKQDGCRPSRPRCRCQGKKAVEIKYKTAATRFRLLTHTHDAPTWGVRADKLTESRNPPPLGVVVYRIAAPAFIGADPRRPGGRSRTIIGKWRQIRVCLPARACAAPHGGTRSQADENTGTLPTFGAAVPLLHTCSTQSHVSCAEHLRALQDKHDDYTLSLSTRNTYDTATGNRQQATGKGNTGKGQQAAGSWQQAAGRFIGNGQRRFAGSRHGSHHRQRAGS